MRITAGKYKGRAIKAPPGSGTRPVLTRVRQAILDVLRPWIEGGRVLDLFCGSGGFLFEALSRGATQGVGVDLDARACQTVKRNRDALSVTEPLEVIRGDALKMVARLQKREERFDVIFLAPPYWKELQPRALAAIDAAPLLLAPDGVVVVQRDRKERYDTPPLADLALVRERTYGNTVFELYAQREAESEAE